MGVVAEHLRRTMAAPPPTSSGSPRAGGPDRMIDAQHRTAVVSGSAGEIAVVDHGGDGPDVVLLHGAHRSLLDWEAVRPFLTGMRLVAYDLRCNGRSDPPADD